MRDPSGLYKSGHRLSVILDGIFPFFTASAVAGQITPLSPLSAYARAQGARDEGAGEEA